MMRRLAGIWIFLLCLGGTLAAAQSPAQAPPEYPRLYVTPKPETLVPGWPLVVDVEIVHAERGDADGARDTVLAPDWHRHLRLDAWQRPRESLRGKPRPPFLGWPFKLTANTSGRLVVSRRGTPADKRVVHFVLSPAETAKILPGVYEIEAELAPRSVEGGGGSWRVKGPYSAQLTVREAPAELTGSVACDAVRAQADYHAALGEPRRAVAVLDEFLVRNAATADTLCWGARGQLAERHGQLREAVEYYRKANRAYRRDYKPTDNPDAIREPPYQLHCMSLLDTLAGRKTGRNEAINPTAEKMLPEKMLGRPRRDTCD
ncbi:tetratricopeptide repeat protein [Pyxidicoccus xibeiensis]|uniref:tetratricopeptide repeat protein n=1 Tax=Pyxidicoccus xibeiensis TaxID=2906759 RepID=UPI0020A7640D|nr:tetratricopeptide repeat protein [Pyxidicoccus xibeiensis]MCP3142972.1 tetratricopeptide repeat protein [Pyxidicoccus xibeiensis]